MKIYTLKINTKKFLDIIDITDKVRTIIQKSNISDGVINVFSRHTTCTIKINEYEDGFFKDLERFCSKFAPANDHYYHNDFNHRDPKTMCSNKSECMNGHSHILQMFIGASSESIPLHKGEMMLGVWQRILLIELDEARGREILVQVIH